MQLFFRLEYKSDINEVNSNKYNPLFKKNVYEEQHPRDAIGSFDKDRNLLNL